MKTFREFNKSKQGWMRIVEAFIAILLIMTVMLVVIQRQRSGTNVAAEIETRQKSILTLISGDELLRSEILSGVLTQTSQKVDYLIPPSYNYSIRLCLISDICGLNFTIPGEVYSQETLITANLTYRAPQPIKLKLFFWRGPYPEGSLPPNYSEPIIEILPTCSNECSPLDSKRCDPILSLLNFQTCGNYDADSCTEWGASTLCGANLMCWNGGCVQAMAVLTNSFACNPTRVEIGSTGADVCGLSRTTYCTDARRIAAGVGTPAHCVYYTTRITNSNPNVAATLTYKTRNLTCGPGSFTAYPGQNYQVPAGGYYDVPGIFFISESYPSCNVIEFINGTSGTSNQKINITYSFTSV